MFGSDNIDTIAVHAGERAAPGNYRPVATPIHPAIGYVYENMDDLNAVLGAEKPGPVYADRYGNPTTAALETAVAALEKGEAAHAFASGMAAVHAALLATGIGASSRVVVAADVYGATFSLVDTLLARLGVQTKFVDVTDHDAVAAALPGATLLLCETISNPLLKVADVAALAKLAHGHGALLLVDNTFATPLLCRPLTLGADMVIHSGTKFLAGHGDVMAGVVVTSAAWRSKLYELTKLVGGSLSPFASWLVLRGLKTMPLRVRQQAANAAVLAEWLARQPGVTRVFYPGLTEHPEHELAAAQFHKRGFGSMIAFELAGAGKAEVFAFMERLQLCLPATTLGDIYSLVLHPMTASHRSLTPVQRAAIGIKDGLVRLSVGIEAVEDIEADLSRALAGA